MMWLLFALPPVLAIAAWWAVQVYTAWFDRRYLARLEDDYADPEPLPDVWSHDCGRPRLEVLVMQTRAGHLLRVPFCCDADLNSLRRLSAVSGWSVLGVADYA